MISFSYRKYEQIEHGNLAIHWHIGKQSLFLLLSDNYWFCLIVLLSNGILGRNLLVLLGCHGTTEILLFAGSNEFTSLTRLHLPL
jgi:hypothetical protein